LAEDDKTIDLCNSLGRYFITDDGLASGYTLLAAINAVRAGNAGEIIVAVCTGSAGAVSLVSGEADLVFCLYVRDRYSFTVADAYCSWYDLPEGKCQRSSVKLREKHLLG